MFTVKRRGDVSEFQAWTFRIAIAMHDPNNARIKRLALFKGNLEVNFLSGRHRISIGIASDFKHTCASPNNWAIRFSRETGD
jgi:hypothetical protein